MWDRGGEKKIRKEGEAHKTKMVFFGVMMNESECAGPRLFNKAEGRHVEVTAKIL